MPCTRGQMLHGQYEIIDQIRQGGFGFVYRARDIHLREDVAIKELIPSLVGSEAAIKRFLTEAKATMRLRHQQIVATHTIFAEAGNYYLVMEYMAGGSLEERLRVSGALPAEDAVRLVAEVSHGLAYAHREGVVHCDLKPANLLADGLGRYKVADFGIAHVSEQMLTRTWHTGQGFAAGTLPYMPPEQTRGVRDDPRIDIYALGAVLYRMLTDRPCLDFDPGDTPDAQARNVLSIQNVRPAPPSRWNPVLPAWLNGSVLKALAKDPQDRYQSMDELRGALLQELETHAAGDVTRAHGAVSALELDATRARHAPVPDTPAPPFGARHERRDPAVLWREQALAAERSGDLELARVAAQRWSTLAPDDGEARVLLARLDRAFQAVQWRDEALVAEKAGAWEVARAAAQNWLELAPQDKAAQALMKRLDRGEQVARWREEALAAERSGQFEAARLAAGHWLGLAPDDEGPVALIKRLDEAAEAELLRAAEYQRAKEALSRRQADDAAAQRERLQQVSEWRQRAQDAAAAGDLEAARIAAQKWLDLAPGDIGAFAFIRRLDEEAQAEQRRALLYQRGRDAIEKKEWFQAVKALSALVEEAPDYRHGAALLARAQEEKERLDAAAKWRDQAHAAERAGQTGAARQAAARWLELAPGSTLARDMLTRLDQAQAEAASQRATAKAPKGWLAAEQLAVLFGFTLEELALNREGKMSPRQKEAAAREGRKWLMWAIGLGLISVLFWNAFVHGAVHDFTGFLGGLRGICIWGGLFPIVGILCPIACLGAVIGAVQGLIGHVTVTQGTLKRAGDDSSPQVEVGSKLHVPAASWKRLAESYPGRYKAYSNGANHLLSIEPAKS